MNRCAFFSICAVPALFLSGCGLKEKFPERAVFVANGGSATVSVIDPADGRVVGEIEVDAGFHPHHVAISPDGALLSVAAPSVDVSKPYGGVDHAGSSKVYLFNASNGDRAAAIDLDATVRNVAFLDDFATVVLAEEEHGELAAFGASKLDAKWSAHVGAGPLEATPVTGGRIAVACSADDTLSIVDAATQGAIGSTVVGDGPVALWSTDAGLFVSLAGDKKVAIVNSGNLGEVLGTYDVGGVPAMVIGAKSGAEAWIAVPDRGVVEVRDPATGDVLQTVEVGGKPHGLAVDADAGLVYVTDMEKGRVVRVDATKYEVKDDIEVGDAPAGIAQNGI